MANSQAVREDASLAIVAGIDEAGYGPLLGPLVVSAVAFEVPDQDADACLWEALSASVTRAPGRHDLRLPVLDSKKLFHRDKGIGTLERTALAMWQSAKPATATFRSLLDRVAPECVEHLDGYPWYAGFDPALLVDTDPGIIATQANVKELEHQKRVVSNKVAKELKDLGAAKKSLAAVRLEVTAQAGEEGKLFGSVTTAQIGELLNERGFKIDRRKIALAEPIKEIGEHKVSVRLHRDVVAEITVVVTATE